MKRTEMQIIWEYLHAFPNKTSAELADAINSKQGNVSSNLTQMVRRNMVERKHRTWINEDARQQTSYEYAAIGNKYTLKPVTLVPAHPRKSPTPKAAPAPHQPRQNPTTSFDIEALTVRQARDLYNKLGAFFGGVK
jgi:hypothetical protein